MNKAIMAVMAALIPAAATAQGVEVRDAYARSANPVTGAAFMVLENTGDVDCRLVGASSDMAEQVGLHVHHEVDGVMKMAEAEDGFAISAQGSHALTRGGDHIMFMGLTSPWEDGDSVAMTLDFGDCGTRRIEIVVDNARMPEDGHGGGKMQHDGH